MANRCIMCKQAAKTVDHLFLHCYVARNLWILTFNLFGIHWVLPSSTHDLLASWWIKTVNKDIKKIWKMVPHALFWCLWKERNLRTFEDMEALLIDI